MRTAEKLLLEIGLSDITPEMLRQESGLSEEAFDVVFDSLEKSGTPALQRLLLRYEERAAEEETIETQMEAFLSKAMQLMIGNGLDFIRRWIRDSLNMEQTYGMSIVFTFWDIVGRIFERAIDEGLLIDDTPVKHLVNTVSAEFFGTVFCWCIMKGTKIEPVHTVCNYCEKDLPVLLEAYLAPVS